MWTEIHTPLMLPHGHLSIFSPFPVSASCISALNWPLKSNRHKLFPEAPSQMAFNHGHGEKTEVWVQLWKVQIKAPSCLMPLQGECNQKRANGNSGKKKSSHFMCCFQSLASPQLG